MEIQEFSNGYCITHKDEDYKYKGKSSQVILMIANKVNELLLKDLDQLKKKIMEDNSILD